MNDVIIFGMGCFVSLVVASAVGLLLWGAANEPRGGVLPTKKSDQATSQTKPNPPAPASARSLESKSLA
jgi:hypothetical protein